jgi:hypothetical protein
VTPQLELPRTRVWRRGLAVEGRVLVAPGEAVSPETIVAEAMLGARPMVVDLGPGGTVVVEGQEVQAGDMLARRKRAFGRALDVRAPVGGKVLLIEGRELLLQPPPAAMRLEAQLPGCIAAVRAGWGADVEGCFGLLRGHGGWGASCWGRLGEDIGVAPEPLSPGVFRALASHGVRAIVAPSWEHEPGGLANGTSIFLTEPLPGRPMAPPIAEALRDHAGQPVALDLRESPLLAFLSPGAGGQQCFGPGSWVRTADGRGGRLASAGQRQRYFESGVIAVPAEVDFGEHTETLALDSLEWIA